MLICYEFLQFSFYSHSKSELKPLLDLDINIKTEVQSIHKHDANTPSPTSFSSQFRNHNNDFNMLCHTRCSNFTSHTNHQPPSCTIFEFTFDWISICAMHYGKKVSFSEREIKSDVLGFHVIYIVYRIIEVGFWYTPRYRLHHLLGSGTPKVLRLCSVNTLRI